jgi:predicted MarR family transcription regulator
MPTSKKTAVAPQSRRRPSGPGKRAQAKTVKRAADAGSALALDSGADSVAPRLFVSSSHLVSPKSRELSEFEFGLIIAGNAFNRWVIRCMAAAGLKDLTTLDVLLLHHVHHRAREKKLADICFMMNMEDTHVVSYSLKKLVGLELVASEKRGKEVVFFTTEAGQKHINRYRDVREACLGSCACYRGSTIRRHAPPHRYERGLAVLD